MNFLTNIYITLKYIIADIKCHVAKCQAANLIEWNLSDFMELKGRVLNIKILHTDS